MALWKLTKLSSEANPETAPGGAAGLRAMRVKTSVIGAVERKGAVVAQIVPRGLGGPEAQTFIDSFVAPDASMLVTDAHQAFKSIGGYPQHEIVNHLKGEYRRGKAHTNTIEGVWAQLKRQINGTHHWVSAKHLQQYVSEMAWRMSRRDMTAQERINALFADVEGRLTYKALIA